MKKILLTLSLATFSALAVNAQEEVTEPALRVVTNNNDHATSYLLSKVKEVIITEETLNISYHNNHAYVDLGLPSGTLWATMNVGAETVYDYGDYFAWGETEAKDYYSYSEDDGTYKWGVYDWDDSENYGMTKYNNTDGLTTLELADDAANANWGGDWRMPTIDEIEELIDNCTRTWTASYEGSGVAGYIVTGTNNNSIFLPAAGSRGYSSLYYDSSRGYYWSSSLGSSYPSDAQFLYFDSGNFYSDGSHRYDGQSVRPVRSSSPSE